MGKADEYQFDYLEDNHRFADQVNGALFQGRQIVKPDELEPADTQVVYLGKEAGSREKFTPIITLVVYCGTEHPWDGARCLHDLLDLDDDMKEFVTNYKLNLYDCHEHDTFDEYHTGLRQLFEVVRYSDDKEKLQKVMDENKAAYNNMDSETRELLEVVANIKIAREENRIMENGERKYNMCKAFQDMKLEGMQEQLIKTVCIKLQKNKPASVIADELEEELPEIEKIIAAQKQVGSYDVHQIYKALEQ